MSLLEPRLGSFGLARRCSVLLAAVALSGCIQPLYGSLPAGREMTNELQAIAVDPIPGRVGHYVGNELIFGFNGTGAQVPAKYHLSVTLNESSQAPLLDTVEGFPTAASIVVSADYKLLPAGGGEPIAKGRVISLASYDRNSQRYGNIRAARDAELRDAKTLADQIRARVAADLAARG
jgi:LPS-assembly lipoprotein